MAGIPDAERAEIPDGKITRYLLDLDHPSGGPKAVFFKAVGFSEAEPERLEQALLAHARLDSAIPQEGFTSQRWRVRGPIEAPNGRSYRIVTVWRWDPERGIPVFVTSFPGRL